MFYIMHSFLFVFLYVVLRERESERERELILRKIPPIHLIKPTVCKVLIVLKHFILPVFHLNMFSRNLQCVVNLTNADIW